MSCLHLRRIYLLLGRMCYICLLCLVVCVYCVYQVLCFLILCLVVLSIFESRVLKLPTIIDRNDAKAEAPVLWPPHAKSWLIGKDWCWEGLGAGEGDDRGWDGWMASLTRWTWVWVSSGSWWWTGRPGVLRFMGSQRVGHNWTELMDIQLCGYTQSHLSESVVWYVNYFSIKLT